MSIENSLEGTVQLDNGAELPFKEWNKPPEGTVPLGVRPLLGVGGISTSPSDWGGLPLALKRHFIAIGIPLGNEHPQGIATVGRYTKLMGEAALQRVTATYGESEDDGPVDYSAHPKLLNPIRSLFRYNLG